MKGGLIVYDVYQIVEMWAQKEVCWVMQYLRRRTDRYFLLKTERSEEVSSAENVLQWISATLKEFFNKIHARYAGVQGIFFGRQRKKCLGRIHTRQTWNDVKWRHFLLYRFAI